MWLAQWIAEDGSTERESWRHVGAFVRVFTARDINNNRLGFLQLYEDWSNVENSGEAVGEARLRTSL